MKLILASNNKAKLREFRRMFEGTEVELVSQREAGFDIEVEETAYKAHARHVIVEETLQTDWRARAFVDIERAEIVGIILEEC